MYNQTSEMTSFYFIFEKIGIFCQQILATFLV